MFISVEFQFCPFFAQQIHLYEIGNLARLGRRISLTGSIWHKAFGSIFAILMIKFPWFRFLGFHFGLSAFNLVDVAEIPVLNF